MIKNLFLSIGFASAIAFSSDAQFADTYLAGTATCPSGALSGGGTNVFILTTNRAIVHSIQLSSTVTGIANFYDCDITNPPIYGVNYTNNTYWTRASYPTNLVTTYISPLTGTTNIFTNSGTFTYFVTNAPNTNNLPIQYSAPFAANLPYFQTGLNLVFARGIVMTTGTNVNYAIGFTP